MDAANYVEWAGYSGLYVGNESLFARYRAYKPKLSEAGFHVIVVHDFLGDNSPVVDVQNWRNHKVYELKHQAQQRVDWTAHALRQIGAVKAAAEVESCESKSLFDQSSKVDFSNPDSLKEVMEGINLPDIMKELQDNISQALPNDLPAGVKPPKLDATVGVEPREHIEHLLETYVAIHHAELENDLARFDDPRTDPDFSHEKRTEELENQHRKQLLRESQLEDIEKLDSYIQQIQKQLDKGKTAKQLTSLSGKLKRCHQLHAKFPDDDLVPEMRAKLQEALTFMKQHPAVFYPAPVKSVKLMRRLDKIGSYELERSGKDLTLTFPAPNGFQCDWTRFALTLRFQTDDNRTVERLLEKTDLLRAAFESLNIEWRDQLMRSFRDAEQYMSELDLEGYEFSADGIVTEESVLAHVDGGSIQISMEDHGDTTSLETLAWIGIEWDEEHGFEINWNV